MTVIELTGDTLVEATGFDTRAMVEIFAEHIAKVQGRMLKDLDPTDLPEIRESVVELYKFGIEVNKLGRETQEMFDKFAKVMHECEVFDNDSLPLVYTPQKREGAGRKPMTPAERLKALQNRLTE